MAKPVLPGLSPKFQVSDTNRMLYKTRKRNPVVGYFDKAFCAWDGEGVRSDGPQPYVLFGNSLGADYTLMKPELHSLEMLQLMLRTAAENPNLIHVGYATDYDVNQILRDIRFQDVLRLKRSGKKKIALRDDWGIIHKFWLEYRPKKYFQVSGRWHGRPVALKIWDIFTFFGTSFVKALKEFVGNVSDIQEIESGKANRENFTFADIDTIHSYWEKELKWLVELATNLRRNFDGAGIRLNSWQGPGSMADALFRDHGIWQYMARVENSSVDDKHGITGILPKEVNLAAQHAFFGGRFEQFHAGSYHGILYQYDINSAYPAAIATLPSLAHGYWEHVVSPSQVEEYGVYRIQGRPPGGGIRKLPMPLPFRDKDGTVAYPEYVDGWYWSPEARLVFGKGSYQIIEGWVFRQTEDVRPFAWVVEMYERRREWKEDGNPLQLALKLALNSLYGKMAQRVGWKYENGEWILPPFHQLEWAGYVTSFCRARMMQALWKVRPGYKVFGVETDGFTTDDPMRDDNGKWLLDIGKRLGQWGVDEYRGITYVQSGLYWLLGWNGQVTAYTWKAKIRGLDRESLMDDWGHSLLEHGGWGVDELTRDYVVRHMQRDPFLKTPFAGKTTRFFGIGQASTRGKAVWRHWITEDRKVFLGGGFNGKRTHVLFACTECRRVQKGESDGTGLHELVIGNKFNKADKQISRVHSLPWLNPKNMQNQEDLISERENARYDVLYG